MKFRKLPIGIYEHYVIYIYNNIQYSVSKLKIKMIENTYIRVISLKKY